MQQFKDVTNYQEIVWPVEYAAGATWLKADEGEDVDVIEDLIKAATVQAEDLAGQDFIPRTYDVTVENGLTCIDLEKWPYGAITHVKKKVLEVETTLALNTDYKVKQYQWGACVELIGSIEADSITVRYTTAPNPNYLHSAKIAIKLMAAKWYDQRASAKHEWPESAEAMMLNIRIRRL